MIKTTNECAIFRGRQAKKNIEVSRLALPHHDSFQRKVAQLVSKEIVEPARRKRKKVDLCELGVGTGVSLYFVMNETQNLSGVRRIRAVDINPSVIEIAKSEFPDPRIDYVNQDVLNFLSGTTQRFESVYSVYTIHNLTPERQEELFRQIFRCLRPGGALVDGDLFAYSDKETQRRAFNQKIEMFERNVPSPQKEEWIAHLYDVDQKNMFILEQAVSLLENIGFRVQVSFREELETVLLAKKP